MVIGGHFTPDMRGTMERFHVTNTGITKLYMGPKLPYQVQWASTVVHPTGEYVYVIGGIKYPDDRAIRDVWMYDVKCSFWSTLPSLFQERSHEIAFILQNVLYVTGTTSDADEPYKRTYMECLYIQQKNAQWKRCYPSLPHEYFNSASCVLNGSVWISGGNKLYQWRPGQHNWEEKWEGMKSGSALAQGMSTDGQLIYLVGEWALEVYDPVKNRLKVLEPPPIKSGVSGREAAYVFGQIIVLGGRKEYRDGFGSEDVYIYNITANKWMLSDVKMKYAQKGYTMAIVPYNKFP